MKNHRIRFAWVIGLAALLSAAMPSIAASLTGVVHDEQGKPIRGAVVAISTAGPKVGTATKCPSCYADCAKLTTTDERGAYTIGDLDSSLKFTVVAVADGFTPRFTDKRIDPQSGALDFRLARRPIVPHEQLFRFKIVDEHGNPIEHAMFEPGTWGEASGRGGGGASVSRYAEPLAASRADGVLQIATLQPDVLISGELSARGFATVRLTIGSKRAFERHPRWTISSAPRHIERPLGDEPLPTVVMQRGATIAGTVRRPDGTPAAGVPVQIVDQDQQFDLFMGWFDLATDSDGRFRFDNVPVDRQWKVYARMSAEGVSEKHVTAQTLNDKTIDIQNLTLQPGHRISGRVILSDGKPIPPLTRLSISREDTWDSQVIELPTDGNFSFNAVPKAELVALNVRVDGYRLKTDDPAAAQMRSPYTGVVDSDVSNITITLEPGKHEFPTADEQSSALQRAMRWEELPLSRLGGK